MRTVSKSVPAAQRLQKPSIGLPASAVRSLGDLGGRLGRAPQIEAMAVDVYATLASIGRIRELRIVYRLSTAAWNDCTVRDGTIEVNTRRTPPHAPANAVFFAANNTSSGHVATAAAAPECLAALEIVAPQIGMALTLGAAVGRMKRAFDTGAGAVRETMRAQDEERQRIARDLHDDLGQSLASLRLQMKLVEDAVLGTHGPMSTEKARAELTEARQSVSTMFEKIRSMSHTLYPRVLDTLGLEPAIQELAHETARQSGIDIRCTRKGRARPIEKDAAAALYRCAQEALSNAIRHAEASKITMELLFGAGEIRLAVEDNGKGFDPAALYDSGARVSTSGFWTIRQRMAGLGGAFRLSTARGRGAVVAMMIPIERRPAAAKAMHHAKNSGARA